MTRKKTVLISTLYTQAHGGVFTKLRFLVQLLLEMNYRVKIAYYLPYSIKPELSIPFQKLFRAKPHTFSFVGELNIEEHAIGATLPELEIFNYYPNACWKNLIETADLYLVVSGHILSALPFYLTKKKYVGWIGTGYLEDRKDRVKTFPWFRKWIDRLLIAPAGAWLEKKLLASAGVYTVSCYTYQQLNQRIKLIDDVIPPPIDTRIFFPVEQTVQPGLICFTGRFLDPRKNTDFLFNVFAQIHKKISYARLCLLGDDSSPELLEKLNRLGISDCVDIIPYVLREELIHVLQKTDVFFIPSFQEGLCISGLEAMACGCPIVSTRCGGPSDYVIDGTTGYLVDFDADDCANKITSICEDRNLRRRMGEASLNFIQEKYSEDIVKQKWMAIIRGFDHAK